jgi:hypothetical protein
MIRTLAIAAAVSALAIPAVAAAADPAFDAFQAVCWAPGDDYMGVLKAASDAGWSDTAVSGGDEQGVSITDKAAKEKAVDGGGRLTLLVTRGLRHLSKGGDLKVTTCKLSFSKADPALIGTATAWLGGDAPDNDKDPTLAIYYVGLASGKPNHVGKPGMNAALAGGGLSILKFQQDSDSSIVVDQSYSK